MTTPTPITRMQQKRSDAANWAALNPILADGEIGYAREADGTGYFKVGDGLTAWNALPRTPDTNNFVLVVEHGTNANMDRPAGAILVFWKGEAEPLNATDYDLWTGPVE